MVNMLQAAAMTYPEREETRESIADRIWAGGAFWMHRRFQRRIADPAAFAAAVAARVARVPSVPLGPLVPDVRYRMRRTPLSDDLLAECFALYTVARGGALSASVLAAARAMMQGRIVELAGREDRRQALALAAAAMALHGTPVHLLAASGARASALAQSIQEPFAALGFRVALVTDGADAGERQDACSRLVLCGTLRSIGLDYLRDRIALGGRLRTVLGGLDRIAGDSPPGQKLLLLGMQCALVDDADEVMLDDSRTPLTVATLAEQPEERLAYEQALELARALRERGDYSIGPEQTELTTQASQRIARLTQALGGAWAAQARREQLVTLALDALHGMQRDRDYQVVRGHVVFQQPVDGDAEPDPSDELLQRLVEVKEGCRLSGRRVVLAQTTVPRVLGRYLHLAGTCSDARGMEDDFWRMYRLRTVQASPHPQPLTWNARLFAKAAWKRTALLEDARERAANGAVVIATRSAPEAQALFVAGGAAGIDLALVRGADDALERQAIARLDHPGSILISVYPAERAATAARGPVPRHLIVADLHDTERHIVQIASAYGADSCTIFASLEDE